MSFETLPDLLLPGLDVVFVGINPSVYSAECGRYFARPGNKFWPALSRSVLSARARSGLGVDVLTPEHDRLLQGFGIGFTDVVKRPTPSAADLKRSELRDGVAHLLEKLRAFAPRMACFHGITGYRSVHEFLAGKNVTVSLGLQAAHVGTTRIFLAPNPSGANAHFSRDEQVCWYDALAAAL